MFSQEFIIGRHPGDERRDMVLACGFNGGGFQMGPMVARLVIRQLLGDQLGEQLGELLGEQLAPVPSCEVANCDYTTDSVDMETLLREMERKFSPSRPALEEYFT